MEKTHEKFSGALREAGMKATAPRLEFLSYLSRQKGPRTLGQISEGVATEMDSATVYRTIPVFVKAGLVKEVSLGAGRTYYEYVDDDHHHLVCTSCGDIEDVHTCDADKITARVLGGAKKFARIERHSLEFFGVCKKCD